MLRDEAEREAERRNSEDERRKRLEFYAFDETAGNDADGWTVAVRLRRGPAPDVPPPSTAAAAAAAVSEPARAEADGDDAPPDPAEPEPEPEAEAEPDELQPTQAYDVVGHEFEHEVEPAAVDHPTGIAPATAAGSVPAPAAVEPEPDTETDPHTDEYPGYEDAYYAEAFPDTPYDAVADRPGIFVATIGAVVLVVGWLWLLMLVALAIVIRPEVPAAIALYLIGFVAGLCVLWLGVAIRRS